MIWGPIAHRLALLELFVCGRLPYRRRAQAEVWDHLERLPWTRTGTRRETLELVESRRSTVAELLDRQWPEWQAVAEALADAGLPPTPSGLRDLDDLRRAEALEEGPALPERLHHKTGAALVGPHSKATLTPRRRAALGSVELTRDGVVRLRPPPGTSLVGGDVTLDAAEVARVLGEVVITDRALRDGTRVVGPFTTLLLVENLGTFQDLSVPSGWLVAQVPGWDTATVHRFLDTCVVTPTILFGDLDPNGVRLARHLVARHPRVRWAVPPCWAEHVEGAPRGDWPSNLDLASAPTLVRRLAEEGRWLEQEPITLDGRVGLYLQALASRQPRRGGPV